MKEVQICEDIKVGPGHPLTLIAGPCVIESEDHALSMARALQEITGELGMPFIFKSSFDKANRSSVQSYRGPGLDEGLSILSQVKRELAMPVTTDVHLPEQVEKVAQVVDIVQIPAFLCRQTDLLLAAGRSGRVVNVKKGQFMAPDDMGHVVEKIRSTGNEEILLTERGSTFGYHNLVVDMRSLILMSQLGCPVVFDATHSVQFPGGAGQVSGGNREHIAPLARAAVGAGVDLLFLEVHDAVDKALCDGANMIPLPQLKPLLQEVLAIHAIRNPQ